MTTIDWERHRKEVHNLGQVQEFLKQIVYGGNDGIVTTFAIVAGFAGAQSEGTAQIGAIAVLLFGLANLFADAVSMGLGEFLSTRSKRISIGSNAISSMKSWRTTPSRNMPSLCR